MSDPYIPEHIYPNTIGEEAYEALKPIVDVWGDEGFLQVYVHALANMLKPVDDIARDGPNGEPGWSQIFDLTRMKTMWLPWAGQISGYQVPPRASSESLFTYDATQRNRINTRRAARKGTNEFLRELVMEQLQYPSTRVIIQNRVGGEANIIKVWVYEEDIRVSAEEVEKAARSAKAVGLMMEFGVLTGANYNLLRANNANYGTLKTKFTDYLDMYTDPGRS